MTIYTQSAIHKWVFGVCLFWIYGYFQEKRINSNCSMHFNGARDMIYLYVNWMRKEFERLLKNNSMNWICLVSILVVSPSKATAQLVLIIYDTLVGYFFFQLSYHLHTTKWWILFTIISCILRMERNTQVNHLFCIHKYIQTSKYADINYDGYNDHGDMTLLYSELLKYYDSFH